MNNDNVRARMAKVAQYLGSRAITAKGVRNYLQWYSSKNREVYYRQEQKLTKPHGCQYLFIAGVKKILSDKKMTYGDLCDIVNRSCKYAKEKKERVIDWYNDCSGLLDEQDKWGILPLRDRDLEDVVRDAAKKRYSRKRLWNNPCSATSLFSAKNGVVYEEPFTYGSSGYGGSYYTPQYTCFLIYKKQGRSGLFVRDGKSYRLILPRDMWWGKDKEGVYFQCGKTSYHPSIEDMMQPNWKGVFRRRIKEKREAVRKQKHAINLKKYIFENADQLHPNMTDSRAAGNCVMGTLSWVKSKLNQDMPVHAPWLMTVSGRLLKRYADDKRVGDTLCNAFYRETLVSI